MLPWLIQIIVQEVRWTRSFSTLSSLLEIFCWDRSYIQGAYIFTIRRKGEPLSHAVNVARHAKMHDSMISWVEGEVCTVLMLNTFLSCSSFMSRDKCKNEKKMLSAFSVSCLGGGTVRLNNGRWRNLSGKHYCCNTVWCCLVLVLYILHTSALARSLSIKQMVWQN